MKKKEKGSGKDFFHARSLEISKIFKFEKLCASEMQKCHNLTEKLYVL